LRENPLNRSGLTLHRFCFCYKPLHHWSLLTQTKMQVFAGFQSGKAKGPGSNARAF
jgi:hypothetical protein